MLIRILTLLIITLIFPFCLFAVTDHSRFIEGTFQRGEDVTRFCLTCHTKQAEDFIKTSHWKWKGPPRTVAGMEDSTEEYGKINLLNNFCISIEGGEKKSNEEMCSKCHPSYGWRDNTFDFQDKTKIDCLICHVQNVSYIKGNAGKPLFMVEGYDSIFLKKAAQSVGPPTRKNCGACHFYGGGGDAVKHGDLDSTLRKPSREQDVHMGGSSDMACQGCHVTKDHKIAGASTLTATHDGRVRCEDCHLEPHKKSPLNETLTMHARAVACQACHIPFFARGQATKLSWDWSTVGQDRTPEEQYGRETYLKHKGTFIWGMKVIPTYAWYNGTIKRHLKGDRIEAHSGTVYISRPVGSIDDKNSKLYPFKVHRGRQPMDTVNGYLLVPHLHNGLWSHYDWDRALVEGAKGSGLPFSGKYDFVSTAYFISINHGVPPKEQALQCNECHRGGKRFDWERLGYRGDPITHGKRLIK